MLPPEESQPRDVKDPDKKNSGPDDSEDFVDDARHRSAGYRLGRRQGGTQGLVDLLDELVRRLDGGVRGSDLVERKAASEITDEKAWLVFLPRKDREELGLSFDVPKSN